jgi:hypothetical protein
MMVQMGFCVNQSSSGSAGSRRRRSQLHDEPQDVALLHWLKIVQIGAASGAKSKGDFADFRPKRPNATAPEKVVKKRDFALFYRRLRVVHFC